MAVASITFSDKPQLEQTSLPISQISIKLYKQITRGLSLGGRFAPATRKALIFGEQTAGIGRRFAGVFVFAIRIDTMVEKGERHLILKHYIGPNPPAYDMAKSAVLFSCLRHARLLLRHGQQLTSFH